MDEKSKKKKKLKQKQKQRQKQNQTVIVNVNSGKSTQMPSNPHNSRVQMPPPVHKVYVSPIHDLIPQMFNKEGKQASQPTLSEQLEKYLKGQEQAKQGNVLGSEPKPNIDANKMFSSPINPKSSKKNQPVSIDKFKNAGRVRGRPPGSLNKGQTKAELRNENKSQSAVLSILASQKVAELNANKKKAESVQPTNLPSQFVQETTYLPKSSITKTGEQAELFYPSTPSNLNDILINQTTSQNPSITYDEEQLTPTADDEEQSLPFYESQLQEKEKKPKKISKKKIKLSFEEEEEIDKL